MIPKFKDIISYHGLYLRAAKRRVRDEPHLNLTDQQVQRKALALLKSTDDLRPRIHKSAKPISSAIEISFLKEFKFFVSMMNLQAGRLTEVVRGDAKDAFATLHEMQRELVTLDAEVEEKEIELLGNYSKVHLNTFSRPTDSQVSYTDKSWLVDFKTGFAFQERYMMDVLPSAGAINPIKEYVKAPIVDAVVIDEGSDAGDSIEPFITSNPRNIFRKNKVFKYAIVRQEFDSSSRRYKPKTSFDTYPWSCTSTMTMQVELANVMHINTLKIHPLGDSTISIKEIRYVNEAGEEIALNALPIDNQTEIVVLFEPVFTKYIIVQFEQFAHVARTEVNIGDRRTTSINRVLDAKGFTVKLPENNRVVKGRTYDFSLKEIQVGLSAYENKGFFRGQNIVVSSPVGMEISREVESIVPIVNFGTYEDTTVLPEGKTLQEAYVGVRLFDKQGNRRMDEICPVLDTGLIQLEYLSPVSKLCRYKLFPDLNWTLKEVCVTQMSLVDICEDWEAVVDGTDKLDDDGSADKVEVPDDTEDSEATGDPKKTSYATKFGTSDDSKSGTEVVTTSINTDLKRSDEATISKATVAIDEEALKVRSEWMGRYNAEYKANTVKAAYKAAQSDLDIAVDVTVGTISGRSIDLSLLKAFSSVSSIVQTGKIDVEMKYSVSDAVIKEYFGSRVYSTMSEVDIARIKQDPILYMGIGGTVFGGGSKVLAYAQARKLYSSSYKQKAKSPGRTWVAFKRTNAREKPTKVATEVFEFEITVMDRKPRNRKKISMARKEENVLNFAHDLNSIKKKISSFVDKNATVTNGTSSIKLKALLPLFNEMRNLIIVANYGYKWNEKNRRAELVYDPKREFWQTPKLARLNKKTKRLNAKIPSLLPPGGFTGVFNNFKGFEGDFVPFAAMKGPKDSDGDNPKDPNPEEDDCSVWNKYFRITTTEPHGFEVGDVITASVPGASFDGIPLVVSIIESDNTFLILHDGSPEHNAIVSYYESILEGGATPGKTSGGVICFNAEGSEPLLEVYKNNALLTIGEDYEISMDDGSTWFGDWPAVPELSSDFYRKAGAGRFYVRLIDYDRSKVYWTKYFVKRNQYLSPCQQVYLRNGRVVFSEKLKYTSGTLQPIIINRMNSAHPYTTSVTTEFSLAIQNRDIVNNPSAKITKDFLSSYLSGESLNVT
jgi:hypothetical protein